MMIAKSVYTNFLSTLRILKSDDLQEIAIHRDDDDYPRHSIASNYVSLTITGLLSVPCSLWLSA